MSEAILGGSGSRRRFLQLLASVPLLVLLPSGLARAARVRILQLRHWLEASDDKRLVLDLDSEARFTVRVYDTPPQVVLQVHEAELAQSLDETFPGDPVLHRVYARPSDEGVEIVIQFSRTSQASVFPQAPSGDRGHRIVVDVTPD